MRSKERWLPLIWPLQVMLIVVLISWGRRPLGKEFEAVSLYKRAGWDMMGPVYGRVFQNDVDMAMAGARCQGRSRNVPGRGDNTGGRNVTDGDVPLLPSLSYSWWQWVDCFRHVVFTLPDVVIFLVF